MILRYYGHALFTITLKDKTTILTDPYGRFCRYPRRSLDADIVTISHHHYDHDSLEMVQGRPFVVDEAGYYLPKDDIVLMGVSSYHDNHTGLRRGKNIIFVIEVEGLRIVHLGDLGHLPDEQQQEKIGTPDLLMIPVGGTFTLDASRAKQCVDMLKPRTTIPMHYQTRYSEDLGIATEQEFVQLMGTKAETTAEFIVTTETMASMTSLLVMDIQE